MKIIIIILGIIIFYSCEQNSQYTKKYLVSKSDDNNWTTSAEIECDSVTMINKNKAILWVDGTKLNLEGQIIKIFSNKQFKKK
jgi:hypothetical protein